MATARDRVCCPPPHVAVHDPYAAQAPHLQLTGQQLVLHLSVWLDGPVQAAPPWSGPVLPRVRVRCPPPQLTEHAVHDPQEFHTQLTGEKKRDFCLTHCFTLSRD